MKNFALFIFCLLMPVITMANGFRDICAAIMKLYGLNIEIRDVNQLQLDKIQATTKALTGTHHYGSQYYDANRYDWSTNDWQQLLALSHANSGSGEMSSAIQRLSHDFPISGELNSPNPIANQYYDLQARTSLTARASSEVAFKQAVKQEKTMQQLHQLIDQTADSKSAEDLNNRLSAENNMNSVQQTKLLAVLVQQTALMEQANANRAQENKAFFNLRGSQ